MLLYTYSGILLFNFLNEGNIPASCDITLIGNKPKEQRRNTLWYNYVDSEILKFKTERDDVTRTEEEEGMGGDGQMTHKSFSYTK